MSAPLKRIKTETKTNYDTNANKNNFVRDAVDRINEEVETLRLIKEENLLLDQSEDKQKIEDLLSIDHIEELISITSSDNSTESSGNAAEELLNTIYGDLSGFDKHIEDNVNLAGYGTREGVVVAILSLIDYTTATGKRIRYLFGPADGRQDPYNTILGNQEESHPENGFGMDCSGVVIWSLTKGGYDLWDEEKGDWKVYAQTDNIYTWACENGYVTDSIEGGQPGDILVTQGRGHVMMVVGTYNDENGGGYYIVEETDRTDGQDGLRASKMSYDELSSTYVKVEMTDFYNDNNNVK